MIGWGHVVYAPVTETVTSTDFVAGWPRGKGKSSKFLTGFFADEDDDRTLRIGIPLWFPILVVGGLTAYAYRKELFAARPAPQDAICSKCNYDRRGLDPAAACPECKSTPNHPD